jgi:hypothetical protein
MRVTWKEAMQERWQAQQHKIILNKDQTEILI